MGDLEIFRSVLKYEMILHKIKMKYDPPNEKDMEYTERDILATGYNIMLFHKSMLHKDNHSKRDFLKMLRNLVRIKIQGIERGNNKKLEV